MAESTWKFSVQTTLLLIGLLVGMGMWAGALSAETQRTREEYGLVLREVKELRHEVQAIREDVAAIKAVKR